jgi:hypothetical protein
MKLLLTSARIKNTSIHNALVEVLGKPISLVLVRPPVFGEPSVKSGEIVILEEQRT